jgi:ABC-2 type transport system permease protein
MPGMPPQGHSFATLQQLLSRDHTLIMEDLGDGSVDPAADLLMVMAPAALDEPSRFAIDQYLMRGGTVILATSAYSLQTAGNSLASRSATPASRNGSRPTASAWSAPWSSTSATPPSRCP